jgi:quinol monooxygenase YgiN
MAFVVAATYTARAGEEERIAAILTTMTRLSRAEPKCRLYQAHRSPDNPRVFFIYEQYTDAEGYEEHRSSPHFREHVRGEAIPRLEAREVATYDTLD